MPDALRLTELDDFDATAETPSVDVATRGELQELTRRLAFAPDSWSEEERRKMQARFDERAETWATRDVPEYRLVLKDALRRGGVAGHGVCLEVGSGTGIQTPTLVAHFDQVLCIEVAREMLRRTPEARGTLLLADASSTPLPEGSIAAIVCVNAPLFAPEYTRILRDDGAVVFVSTRGAETPIYLAPRDVIAALTSLGDKHFVGVTARAGPGNWTVARREPTTDTPAVASRDTRPDSASHV